MPSGQFIVDRALLKLGILDQGGTAAPSDSADALDELNDMWTSWGVDEGLIYSVERTTYVLSAGRASYTFGAQTIGPNAPDFLGPIPQKIFDAYYTLSSASSASSALIMPATASVAPITINDGNVLLVGTATVAGVLQGSLTSTPGTANPLPLGVTPSATVTANNTVSFYAENLSGGPVTLASNVWTCVVIGLSGSSSVAVSAVIQQGQQSFSGIANMMDGTVSPVGVIPVLGATPGSALTTPGVTGGSLPDRVRPSASITAPGSVTIYVENLTGGPVNIPALTYSIAVIGQSSATAGQIRRSLNVVTGRPAFSHGDQNATAYTPDEFYFDYNAALLTGYATGYVWPITTAFPASLELVAGVPFTEWTLTDNYFIPRNISDPLILALAFRLLPSYGAAVDQQLAQTIVAQGQKAELRFREANKFQRGLQPGTEMLEPPQTPKQVA